MKITIKNEEGRLVGELIGDLDNTASSMAEKELAPLLECDDRDIVLECRELDYISSSGLRILLNIYKNARRSGHRAFIRNLNEDVTEVFRIGGFLQLFELID
jgi:anti-sigma B factor antagonist